MKTLPNGLVVFNGTNHPLTFWKEGWEEPVEVLPDRRIDARIEEQPSDAPGAFWPSDTKGVEFVTTRFVGTPEGYAIIEEVREETNVIVGSLVAAQAYPGDVVAVTPAPGYERVRPPDKRMSPDKFTVF